MSIASKTAGIVLATVAVVLLAVPAFAQSGEEAQVRVAHLSPDAPSVDVYVNDEPVDELGDVSYGTVSTYLPLSAGSQNVKVYAAGNSSDPVIDADLDLRAGAAYTVAAIGLVGDDSLQAQVYEDDNSLPAGGDSRLRVIHASPDVDSVDIGPKNSPDLFTNVGFPNATKYAAVPADTYPLVGTLTGSGEVAFTADATLAPKTVYTVFGIGLANEGTFKVMVVEDAGTGGGSEEALPMPDTGGVSTVWILCAALLLAVAGTSVLWRLGKTA